MTDHRTACDRCHDCLAPHERYFLRPSKERVPIDECLCLCVACAKVVKRKRTCEVECPEGEG